MKSTRRRTKVLAGGAAAALALGLGVHTYLEHEEEEENGHESVAGFLREHPALNTRSQAINTIREKLEGGAESATGPNQMRYEDNAFPRSAISSEQSAAARQTFQAKKAGNGGGKGTPPGLGTWTLLPNQNGYVAPEATYTGKVAHVSGRVTSLVVDPNGKTVYVGSAGGGVWKTDDITAASPTWRPISDSLPTQAIGTLTLDRGVLYVGTGEPNGSSDSEAGLGLFKSTDGGATYTEVKGFTPYAKDRSVATVAVDPANANHLLVGTALARHGSSSVNGGRMTPPGAPPLGLYETTDGGATWTQVINLPQDAVNPTSANGSDFFRGGVTKVAFDPLKPGTSYAAAMDYGLYRRQAGETAYTAVYSINTPGAAATSASSRLDFAATVKDGKTRIYLGDATKFNDSVAGLLRTDDATAATVSWTSLSSADKSSPGYDSYNFCHAQCSYDMVVATPAGQPDTVLLSGAMNYNEIFTATPKSNGRAVVRSTNAGVSFTDMTNDASNNGLHPDHHALVFMPNNPNSWLVGDDGGVAVESGPFVDKSADCDTRGLSGVDLSNCKRWLSAIPSSNRDVNQGLQTLQYQSVSVQNGIVQGGTQDNGTWESDLAGQMGESVGGDGGNSYINPANTGIRMHSYYSAQLDVTFRGSDPKGWNWVADPLMESGEGASFYVPVEGDKTAAGTVYVGLQHVWRTTDNGGDQAYLEKHCNEYTGDFTETCGDWKPLGGGAGDLSGAAFGSDYAGSGNYVVAIAHAQRKTDVMWAATRRGRLFVTTNANAADPGAVTFTRLDKTVKGAALPTRFVTGISLDPTNPYHAVVSYSGYSAYAAGGHVYDLTYDPASKTITAKDLSADLGDQPVTAIALDWRTGAIYAGTDFGVLVKPAGVNTWMATPGMPMVAVYGLTLDDSGKRLYAATHGRGVYVNRTN